MKTPAEVITTLTGCKNADLVAVVLEAAEQTILSLTNRTKLIPQLEAARRDLGLDFRQSHRVGMQLAVDAQIMPLSNALDNAMSLTACLISAVVSM